MGIYSNLDFDRYNLYKREGLNEKVYDDGKVVGIKQTTTGIVFYISKEDEDYVRRLNWAVSDGYLHVSINGITIALHRYIMDRLEDISDKLVDHIDRNTFNNTRENLRVVNRRVNVMNSVISDDNIHFGLSGVVYDSFKNNNRFFAHIIINNYPTYLGSYSSPYEAGFAYDAYIRDNLPEDIWCTNYARGLYPPEILEQYGIKCIEDIPVIPNNRTPKNNYFGIFKRNDRNLWRVNINNKWMGHFKTESEALMFRETYLEEHNEEIIRGTQTNIYYPEHEGKIIICGIAKTKQESLKDRQEKYREKYKAEAKLRAEKRKERKENKCKQEQ